MTTGASLQENYDAMEDARAKTRRFDGETFEKNLDGTRLTTQLERVEIIMFSVGWITLAELAQRTGGSQAGVSARLRDLRKPEFGGYTVVRRRAGGGLFEYRIGLVLG